MKLNILYAKDKGDITKERLVLKVLEDANTSGYVVVDATYDSDGDLSNLGKHAYKFPSKDVKKGDYVILFTKAAGSAAKVEEENQSSTTNHNFYWGRKATVWNKDGDYCTLLYIVDSKKV